MNDITDYDPLAAARGQSNSALAKAAILKENQRQEKLQKEKKEEEQLNRKIEHLSGVLKEIAYFLGVPHTIKVDGHFCYLILQERDCEIHGLKTGSETEFVRAVLVNNQIELSVARTIFSTFLRRRVGEELKYKTIWPEQSHYFFKKNYLKELNRVKSMLQDDVVKMLAEESPKRVLTSSYNVLW
jgi:hypothetical protein